MKLSNSEEATLIVALSEALQVATLNAFGYVHLAEKWEKKIRDVLTEDFRVRLYKNLDEGGLTSLIQRFIRNEVGRKSLELPPKPNGSDYSKSQRKIKSYKEFADSVSIARQLVLIIASAPLQYEVFVLAFPISRAFLPEKFQFEISDQLSLVSADLVPEDFEAFHPIEFIDGYCRNYESATEPYRVIDKEAVYFRYRTSGLISDRMKPKKLQPMYDDIRAFYGAAMAFDLVAYHSFFKEEIAVPVFVNRIKEGTYELCMVEKVETDLHDASQTYPSQKLREADRDVEKCLGLFEPVIRLFRSKEVQRLRTSAIWLLRSFLSERGMDRILDSTIAIEVLLGDKEASDRVGLSKLMANRCAYSLGRSSSERQELHEFFIQFYRVRSDIVHSGRLNLLEGEKDIVEKGLQLAARILRHEIEMN